MIRITYKTLILKYPKEPINETNFKALEQVMNSTQLSPLKSENPSNPNLSYRKVFDYLWHWILTVKETTVITLLNCYINKENHRKQQGITILTFSCNVRKSIFHSFFSKTKQSNKQFFPKKKTLLNVLCITHRTSVCTLPYTKKLCFFYEQFRFQFLFHVFFNQIRQSSYTFDETRNKTRTLEYIRRKKKIGLVENKLMFNIIVNTRHYRHFTHAQLSVLLKN